MMRSLRWLQSRLARTGAAFVLLGAAVGCTPAHSNLNGQKGTPSPSKVGGPGTAGLGATSPAFANLQGANPGLVHGQLNNTGAPSSTRLMNTTPGAAGAQLQQPGLNYNSPGSFAPQGGSPQAPVTPVGYQAPAQQQYTLPAHQVPTGNVQQAGAAAASPGVPVQQPVPLPLPGTTSQLPAPTTPPALKSPEPLPTTVTQQLLPPAPSQSVQQSSSSQMALPVIDPPTLEPAPASTNAGKVLFQSNGRSSVPPPVSSTSEPGGIAPAQMSPRDPGLTIPRSN